MPPPNKKRDKTSAPDAVQAFELDGIRYRFDPQLVENEHEQALFLASGMTTKKMAEALKAGSPPFAVAGLMYLAERQAGKQANYDALRDSIDRHDVDFKVVTEDDAPEA